MTPTAGARVSVKGPAEVRRKRVAGGPTYRYQLAAFVAAVRGDGAANLTPPADSLATMRVIDAIYAAAGMPPRQPTPA